MAHFILVLGQALQTFCPPTSERVGTEDLQAPRGTKPEGGFRGAVGVKMITIGGTGTMGEMEVGEGGGEGDVVVIKEVGTIDRRTGTWIVMIGDRCPLDDICGVDEVDRGVLHREVPDMGIFHEETNVSGVPPVWTHVNHQHPYSQLP